MSREDKEPLEKAEEDVTMYGEMIPSLHNWMTPDNQRQRVRQLEEEISDELSKRIDKKL